MSAAGARRYRVLLVDDDPGLLRLLTIRLKSEGYDVAACESAAQAQASVPRFRPDVVITDLKMAEQDGIGLLKDLQRRYPALPVVLMTAHGTIPDAVEATQSGAFAFLTKPIDRDQMLETIDKALRVSGFVTMDDEWRAGIVTHNPLMEERLAEAQMAARTESCVLIVGQSGTGKRLLAEAIHRASQRSGKELTFLSCGSLPVSLLEDTVAQGAAAGTVVLDEIGALDPRLQERIPALLSLPVDQRARLISTTGRDLRALAGRGEFREELLYKLSAIQIELPPLSQRRDDIPLIARRALEPGRDRERPARVLAPEALELLVAAEFPDNVRQLRAVVQQAASLATGAVISAEAIQRALGAGASRVPAFDEARDEFTRNYLIQLLQLTRGNVTQAAKLAGRNRTDFYKLLGRHKVSPDDFKSV